MSLLIYGANGYTAELIARELVSQGQRPILAGRNAGKLEPLARSLGLEHRAFALDGAGLDAHLAGVKVILNAVGEQAQAPLLAAALRLRAHYLDLAGEYPAFQKVQRHDQAARQAGVMLLPGVGFGVVPTDMLAAHLARRLPGATHLTPAFATEGGVSGGTLETVLGDLPTRGARLEGGVLKSTPAAWRRQSIDFGRGPVTTLTHPWRADVFTAQHSTGIANVHTLLAVPAQMRPLFGISRHVPGLLGLPVVQQALRRAASAPNPTPEQRSSGWTSVWAEVRHPSGQVRRSRLDGPEAYSFTALSAADLALSALRGEVRPGFQTPSSAYGPDRVLRYAGVQRHDF